jgi:thiamine pyrophosphokinase
MPRAVIFANGVIPDVAAAGRLLKPGDRLIAVDGGLRYLNILRLRPVMLIGDLDSTTVAELAAAEAKGVRIERHPRDKNETDLELALQAVLRDGHTELLIIGGVGGRLDQTLGNLALLSDPAYAGMRIAVDDGLERASFVRDSLQVDGQVGDLVSLIPWGGEARGVTTSGLRWPLKAETLHPERTRGVSNELAEATAAVSLESGLLLVVQRRKQ